MIRKIMHLGLRGAAITACLVLGGGLASAQARCPWLNVATAGGVLGGPVTLEIQRPAANETHCMFRRDDSVLSLEIVVNSQEDASRGLAPELPTCTSPGTPVRAIGNEALVCADDRKPGHGAEVIGRVRDSLFRVVVSGRSDPALTRDVLEQKARDVAEQVAGSLF